MPDFPVEAGRTSTETGHVARAGGQDWRAERRSEKLKRRCALLGYFIPSGRGQGDRLLQEVASRLVAQGVALTGVVQTNVDYDPERPCHMYLQILGQSERILISQERGRLARGCRLDTDQLARAVYCVDAALDCDAVSLLIINKFGQQECDGAGFRDVLGKALSRDIAVLTAVSQGHLQGFRDFAQGMETRLDCDSAQLVDWCRQQIPRPQGAAR